MIDVRQGQISWEIFFQILNLFWECDCHTSDRKGRLNTKSLYDNNHKKEKNDEKTKQEKK